MSEIIYSKDYGDGIYQIKNLGYVYGPGYVCSTLIVGKDKALLFDTGNGFGDLRGYVEEITQLPIIVVNSHGHSDHTGGNYQFDEIWMMEEDYPICDQMKFMKQKDIYSLGDKNSYKKGKCEINYLKDGQIFDLGERTLTVICTPGHTLGCVCLYDSKTKIMMTGDTLSQRVFLFGICQKCVPFKTYRESLEHLEKIPFDHFLAGHHMEIFKKEWLYKMKKLVDEFSPEKGSVYERSMSSGDRLRKYTVGRGFGDPDYCGFVYNENELSEFLTE